MWKERNQKKFNRKNWYDLQIILMILAVSFSLFFTVLYANGTFS